MNAVSRPEEVDFVRHSVEPVVAEVYPQEGEDAHWQGFVHVEGSPMRVDVTVHAEFQCFARESAQRTLQHAVGGA